MSNIKNAGPSMVYRGVQDISGRQVTPEPEAIPMHMPYFWTFAQKGKKVPQLVTNNGNELYGADTFDYRKRFANHQTPFIKHTIAKANACYLQRLIPDDAKQATQVLWCAVSNDPISEIVPEAYKRSIDPGQGVTANETVARKLIFWYTAALTVAAEQSVEGAIAALNGVTEGKIIQIGEEQVNFTARPVLAMSHDHGEYGNNLGINLVTPTMVSADPVNDQLALDQGTLLHRLKFMTRKDVKTKPSVIKTLNSEEFVEFSFKEGVINTQLDSEVSFEKVLEGAYENTDESTGLPPVYGPTDNLKFFRSNYEGLLKEVVDTEKARFDDGFDQYLYNIFGGVDIYGDKYYTFRVLKPQEHADSIVFGDNTVLYSKGGTDGTCDTATFNRLVAAEIASWGDKYELLDEARWPYSTFWDSGFDLETKKSLISLMGKRQDVWVALSTHIHGMSYQTPSEEQSVATALKTYVGMYPESTYYGTPFMRGICVPGPANLTAHKCPWKVPALIHVLDKVAKYMGNGQGVMRKGKDFDQYPGNVVEIINGINNAWKPVNVRNKDWELGMSTIQRFDTRTFFMPGLQTLYDDDTSVVNGAINMFIAVEGAKICRRAWARMTGVSKLTKEQFIERSNEAILALIKDKFDDRVVITPRTFFTAADNQRGYSWHCELLIQMNNMMTVGTYSVVVDRLEG